MVSNFDFCYMSKIFNRTPESVYLESKLHVTSAMAALVDELNEFERFLLNVRGNCLLLQNIGHQDIPEHGQDHDVADSHSVVVLNRTTLA